MSSVSVISTVLNEAQDIDWLVTSLMAQTLAPTEVIIVDGGSTDGTWERLLAAKARYPNLIPVRDESCSLARCPGPISRGRNVAIRAATSEVIACADAGCGYDPDWLQRLTVSILNGDSEYAVGGSCVDPEHHTVWDIASAPFLGVKLSQAAKTKSCAARSVAFRKELWQRVGGFPEEIFLGEDTVFDMRVRAVVTPAFADRAKAYYRPLNSFTSAVRQVASYSVSDGVSGARPARLFRNFARCAVEVAALAALVRSPIPLLCVGVLELYFAFRLDWRDLRGTSVKAFAARVLFSLLVPWIVAWNQVWGSITRENRLNRQNAG